jgi:PTS system nitrogen regulatory IIA component
MDATTQLLCPQLVELDLVVSDRESALRAASMMIASTTRISAPPVFRALLRREMAGSTAIGNRLAIPHARIAGIADPVTAYLRLKAPLEFGAPDRMPVTELFVILVPGGGDPARHLQLLALVAEAFSDSGFRNRLAKAEDQHDVRRAFSDWIGDKDAGANAPTASSAG